jgi:hypothetical protein
MTAYAVAPGAIYAGRSPIQDRAYLQFVRDQGFCMVRNCKHRYIEAAHTGARGLGTKADDARAVNLCGWHHRTSPNALHKLGPVKFARFYRLDFNAIIARLNKMYREGL